MSASVLTTIATVVAATATVVYMFWEKAQEKQEERERMMSFNNNSPMMYATPVAYDAYGYPMYSNATCVKQNPNNVFCDYNYNNNYNHSTYNERCRRYAQLYYNNQYPYDQRQNMMNQSEYHQQTVQPNNNGSELITSRRYMNQDDVYRMRLRQQGTYISPVETMVAPSFSTVPGDTVSLMDVANGVYEDRNGHREMVDMHDQITNDKV